MSLSKSLSPVPRGERTYIAPSGVGAIIDHDPITGCPWLIYADGVEIRVKDQTQAMHALVGQILRSRAHDEKISVVDRPPDSAISPFKHLALELSMAEDVARKIVHQALNEEAHRRWEYRRSAVAQTTRELTGAGLVWEDAIGPFSDIPIPKNFTHRIALIEGKRAITVRIGTEAAMWKAWQTLYAGSEETYIMDKLDGGTNEETETA